MQNSPCHCNLFACFQSEACFYEVDVRLRPDQSGNMQHVLAKHRSMMIYEYYFIYLQVNQAADDLHAVYLHERCRSEINTAGAIATSASSLGLVRVAMIVLALCNAIAPAGTTAFRPQALVFTRMNMRNY